MSFRLLALIITAALSLGLAGCGSESPVATTSAPAPAATAEAAPQEAAPTTVPDVTGLYANDATQKMREMGIMFTVVARPSDSVQSGRIIETDPPEGTAIASGETVTVVKSTGPRG